MKKLEYLNQIIPLLDVLFKELYEEFTNSEFFLREELPTYGGVYVFYKSSSPSYVGMADNIRKRIAGHTRPSSGHNSANSAFNLAKLELAERLSETKLGRKIIEKDPEFAEKFVGYKKELSASKIKCIKVENDVIQTMFEPYLSVKLGTYPHHNSFNNH